MVRYPRPCSRCGKTFQPDGKYQKICNECQLKARDKNQEWRKNWKGRFN